MMVMMINNAGQVLFVANNVLSLQRGHLNSSTPTTHWPEFVHLRCSFVGYG